MAEAAFAPQEGEIVVLQMEVVTAPNDFGQMRVKSAAGPIAVVYLPDVVEVKPKPLARLDKVRSVGELGSEYTGRIVHIEGTQAWVQWETGCPWAPIWPLVTLRRA